LLGSSLAAVRGWAIARLAATLEPSPQTEALLWRALCDPVLSLRLRAARGLLAAPHLQTPQRVRQVVEVLGDGVFEEAVQAAQTLGTLGVAEEPIRAAIATLEQERPTTCAVCGLELAGKDRYSHLVTVHGYLDLDGTLLPRTTVEARLWDRVLLHGDLAAHRRLLGILDAPSTGAT